MCVQIAFQEYRNYKLFKLDFVSYTDKKAESGEVPKPDSDLFLIKVRI